jgi:hypothetical protein
MGTTFTGARGISDRGIRAALLSVVLAALLLAMSLQGASALSLAAGLAEESASQTAELNRVLDASTIALSSEQILFLEQNAVLPGAPTPIGAASDQSTGLPWSDDPGDAH